MCCTKRRWPGFGWGKTVHVCSLVTDQCGRVIREHSRVLETQEWVQVLALTRLYLTGLSKEKKIYRLDLETKANADTEVNG